MTVRVYGELRRHLPSGWRDGRISLPAGATVADMLAFLSIPAEEVGLVSLDGAIAEDSTLVAGAQEIRIFPPVGGGID